jgi:hypothetical protein
MVKLGRCGTFTGDLLFSVGGAFVCCSALNFTVLAGLGACDRGWARSWLRARCAGSDASFASSSVS